MKPLALSLALSAALFSSLCQADNWQPPKGLYADIGAGYEFFKPTFGRNPLADFALEYCQPLNLMTSLCGGWRHHSSIPDGAPFDASRPDENVMDAVILKLRIRLWEGF